MCGIAGIATFNKDGSAQAGPMVEHMLDLMRYRGPDDRGSLELDDVVLGHLRLSILDLSRRGHQPMSAEDERYWITYNGEIYNYIELRKELEAQGAVFHSDTDTEVILHAYHLWGNDCFVRFNGMWALAIYDCLEKHLILCRDRLGIKPLYWCENAGQLAFGSEVKSLAAYLVECGENLTLNNNSLSTYINSGLVDGLEDTFFQGIRRFKPGYLMVINQEGIQKYQQYWDLPDRALHLREELAGAEESRISARLLEILGDAVKIHSRSDVPVGVCLSGGLDSSAVAAMASPVIPHLKSFTTWFAEGDEYNELEHSRRVVKRYDLDSFEEKVDGEELLPKLTKMLWHLDEPTLAMGVFPHWHVMQAASREVTVVMDGQGGDELFAGYDFYTPWFLSSRLADGDKQAYETVLQGFADNYGPQRATQLDNEARQLLAQNTGGNMPQRFPGRLDNFLLMELTQSRLPALLRYEDRLSMAFSIESRVPLLDYRLTELAFALTEDKKIGPGWSKYILRQALNDTLPHEVTWRKDKKGFPTPFEVWAENGHKQEIRDTLLTPGGRLGAMMDRNHLNAVFQQWDQGQRNTWLLWRLLSMELWLREYEARLRRELDQSIKKHDGQEEIVAIPAKGKPGEPILQARQALEEGEAQQAVNLLTAELRARPDNAEAAKLLGQTMLDHGQIAKAAALLERAAQTHQTDHQLQNLAGISHVQSGNVDQALRHFEFATQAQPDNASYSTNVGKCLFLIKDWQRAHEVLSKAATTAEGEAAQEIEGLLKAAQAELGQKPRIETVVREMPPEKPMPESWMDDKLAKMISPPENRQAQVADDAKLLEGVRILHAPSEICGNLERLARNLRNVGIESRSVNYGFNTWADYKCDYNLDVMKMPPRQRAQAMQEFFNKVADQYNIFHFHYGRTLLPNLADLDILRQKGKKVVFSFWGSDHRSDECVDYLQARFLGYDPPQPYFLNKVYNNLHKPIDHFSQVLMGSACIPRGIWAPGIMDTTQWTMEDKQRLLEKAAAKDPDKLYVIHAPSDPRFKGSKLIKEELDRCKAQGLPIETIYVTGMPLSKAKELYCLADCAVDNLAGDFGGFGAEMMLWQIPVMVYHSESFKQMRDNPPLLHITKDTFAQQLESCWRMKNNGELAQLGAESRQWIVDNVEISTAGLPVYTAIYRMLMAGENVPQYINLDWRQQDMEMGRGVKRDFYRFMEQNNVYAQIGIDTPTRDPDLYL